MTDFAMFTGLTIPDDCGKVQAWFDKLNARPSAQAWPGMAAVMERMQAG